MLLSFREPLKGLFCSFPDIIKRIISAFTDCGQGAEITDNGKRTDYADTDSFILVMDMGDQAGDNCGIADPAKGHETGNPYRGILIFKEG